MGTEGLRLILHAFNEEGVNQGDAPHAARRVRLRKLPLHLPISIRCVFLGPHSILPHGIYLTRETSGA